MLVTIFGGGSVGLPLAAALASAGRKVLLVRTSHRGPYRERITISVRATADGPATTTEVDAVSLDSLGKPEGILVVATKATANAALASALAASGASGPVVILQNGLGVERPFVSALRNPIYRGVLYLGSQAGANAGVVFRQVESGPVGVVRGSPAELETCVAALNTDGFRFRVEPAIERQVWGKTIINSVFNSICPLLDIDNGIFVRDPQVAALGDAVVAECVRLARAEGLDLSEAELKEKIAKISRSSAGILISTLQDVRAGRETEIAHFNVELARIGEARPDPIALPTTKLLGQLVLARSRIAAAGISK